MTGPIFGQRGTMIVDQNFNCAAIADDRHFDLSHPDGIIFCA
jgi:hypothetical protein